MMERRRQRISNFGDSEEFDRRMELPETVRLRDRERFQVKEGDRNREFQKRRRIESRRSSDEEGEDALKINQQNRGRIRTVRTSPVVRSAADDVIGVPVPRRARSSLRKRSHDEWSSGGGGSTEEAENKNSDDEIEVVEALFKLMENQPSEKLDRDSTENTVDDELGITDEVGGAEQSMRVDVDTSTVHSIEEVNEGKVNEKQNEEFQDEPTQELLSKEKVQSRKESDSTSGSKVNACGIQDQTVTKAVGLGMDSQAVMGTIKENKLRIDLMALPSLPSSPERNLVDMASDPKVMAQDRQAKGKAKLSDSTPAASSRVQQEIVGTLSSNQLLNLVSGKQPSKEWKHQAPTSLLPFPMPTPTPTPTNGSTGLLTYPGYMRSIQPGLPMDRRVRSSLAVQPPLFKSSQLRLKRCATHENIARFIHYHQQELKKSLVSGPNGSSNFYEMKHLDPNSVSLRQKFAPRTQLLGPLQAEHNYATTSVGGGRDKRTEVATSKKLVPHQPPANNILHGPGFYYHPFGGNTSLSPNLPGKAAASVSFNHPNVPPNESTPYVAILPKNSGPIPINQAPNLPVFSSSFYSSQSQQQLTIPHNLVQSVSQNTTISNSSSSHKPPTQVQQQPNTKINDNPHISMNFAMLPHLTMTDPQKSRELNPQAFAMSFSSNASTTPSFNFSSSSPPAFHMLHDMSRNAYQMSQQSKFQTPEGKTTISFPNLDKEVKGKGILGKSPDSSAASSITIPNFQQQFNQDRFLQLQKHHMQKMNNNNTILTRFAPAQTDNNSSSSIPQWINMPKSSQGQSQSHIPSFGNSSFQGHLGHNGNHGQQILANAGSKPSQQVEASSSNGSATVPKASSPACRRNVPSILTSGPPPQLSEFKY